MDFRAHPLYAVTVRFITACKSRFPSRDLNMGMKEEKKMRIRNAAIFALLLLVPLTTFGQRITGSIEGRISDASGAVLPGVEVTVTNDATGLVRTFLSNETGRYNFPVLPPGA